MMGNIKPSKGVALGGDVELSEELTLSDYLRVVLGYKKVIIFFLVMAALITPVVSWKNLGYESSCLLDIGVIDKEPILNVFQVKNVIGKSEEFKNKISEEMKKKLSPEELKQATKGYFEVNAVKNTEDRKFPLMRIALKKASKAYAETMVRIVPDEILNISLKKYNEKLSELIFGLKKEITTLVFSNNTLKKQEEELDSKIKILENFKENVSINKDSLTFKKGILVKKLEIIPIKIASIDAGRKVMLNSKPSIEAKRKSIEAKKGMLFKEKNSFEARKKTLEARRISIDSEGESLGGRLEILNKSLVEQGKTLEKIKSNIREIDSEKKELGKYRNRSIYSLLKSYIWSSSLNMGDKMDLRKEEIHLMDKIRGIKLDILSTRHTRKSLYEKKAEINEYRAGAEKGIALINKRLSDADLELEKVAIEFLKHEKALVDFKEKPILLEEDKFKIKQEISKLRSEYVQADGKILEYEKQISNVLIKQGGLISQRELNKLNVKKLQRDIEKLKSSTNYGTFKGISKPVIIAFSKVPSRPVFKVILTTFVSMFASLIASIFVAFFLNYIKEWKETAPL